MLEYGCSTMRKTKLTANHRSNRINMGLKKYVALTKENNKNPNTLKLDKYFKCKTLHQIQYQE